MRRPSVSYALRVKVRRSAVEFHPLARQRRQLRVENEPNGCGGRRRLAFECEVPGYVVRAVDGR